MAMEDYELPIFELLSQEEADIPVRWNQSLVRSKSKLVSTQKGVVPLSRKKKKTVFSVRISSSSNCDVLPDSDTHKGSAASLSDDGLDYSPEFLDYIDETVERFKSTSPLDPKRMIVTPIRFNFNDEGTRLPLGSNSNCSSTGNIFKYVACLDIPNSVDADVFDAWLLDDDKVGNMKRKLCRFPVRIQLPMVVNPMKINRKQ